MLPACFFSTVANTRVSVLVGSSFPRAATKRTGHTQAPSLVFSQLSLQDLHPPHTQEVSFSSLFLFFSCYPSPGKDKATMIKITKKVTKTHNKLSD